MRWQYRRQHGLPRYECLQPEYNLVSRDGYEKDWNR